MLFNSLDFAIFLPVVFLLYWFVANRSVRAQNLFVTIASYIFYGWWDVRFLGLIALSTLVDYSVGLAIDATASRARKKTLLWLSISTNIGILAFFKYFNFFADSLVSAYTIFGNEIQVSTLTIVLPVGISFYTLQTLSYTIDVYRGHMKPTRDFFAFSSFVCFFPQLVAGPIERATNLLPQFLAKRTFEYTKAIDGVRQILWGVFTKVVVADNCAACANAAFNNTDEYSGLTLIAGALLFSLQIYGDFSGYSNIAIGTSKLFGFELMRNFAFPYFSRDIAEFWRRWHISLSTWFRDYVYIPLGGSRCARWKVIRNVFIIFLLSGLWHGANWTFVVWGALHATFFLPLLILGRNRNNMSEIASGRWLPSIREAFSMAMTFSLCVFAWIFFRAETLSHALNYIQRIATRPLLQYPEIVSLNVLMISTCFLIIEWIGREEEYAIASLGLQWPRRARVAMYYAICIAIVALAGEQQDFIYFQF